MKQLKRNEKIPGNMKRNLAPVWGSLLIMIIYVVLGVIWILTSDYVLHWIVGGDHQLVDNLQSFKGVFYVVMTAILFYFIIKRRMDLYYQSINQLKIINEELNESNDNLQSLEKQLYELAYFDVLTNLPNKNRLQEVIKEHHKYRDNELLGIVYIDIDDFKTINEVKGFDAGDKLIKMLSRDMMYVARAPHEVFRFGGDQFIILLRGLDTREHLEEIINRYAKEARRSFLIDEYEYFFTTSVGISAYPQDGITYEDLIQHAEMALQVAKTRGPGSIVIYEPKFDALITDMIDLTNMLHGALPNNEFMVYYQPIYNIENHQADTFEALIRWKQEKRGFIPPLEFIPTAEKSGQIVSLTHFVIERCFQYYQDLRRENLKLKAISINLSSRVLLSHELMPYLEQAIAEFSVDTKNFIFEITESHLLDNYNAAIEAIKKLRSLGFKIALDDFGTGYSSLTYLQQLPLDILKIDRSFIQRIESMEKEYPLLRFMIELGHSLGLRVVAEGVETELQYEKLVSLGIDDIQGYLYSRPIAAFDATTFLMEHQKKHEIS